MGQFRDLINERISKGDLLDFEDSTIQYDLDGSTEEYYVSWAEGNKLRMQGKHGSKGDIFDKTITLKYINDNKLKIKKIKDGKPDWMVN
jgi:hypothetical protein